ncbi:10438_t:CDS:1 [Ambispora gerdemannii]|uniref:10438_t:CDS:1 n=1 Tax=Ambispora gerdemannii TaxID=144530 RepID=A0A9N8W708_9GLOM|nr:10438_t:CDS:1 [Ambispora gerdemannii]
MIDLSDTESSPPDYSSLFDSNNDLPAIINNNNNNTISPTSPHNQKIFFTYPATQTSFQKGFLGVEDASICGTLHLRYSRIRPLLATKIMLTFTGKLKIVLEKSYVGFRTNDLMNKKIFKDQTIYSKTLDLWSSATYESEFQAINCLDLPFQFDLPAYLESTISLKPENQCYARIYYTLKATVHQKPDIRRLLRKTKILKVNCLLDRYSTPWQINNSEFCLSSYDDEKAISRGIGYNLSLAQRTILLNSRLNVTLNLIFHDARINLKKILCILEERYVICVDDITSKIKKSEVTRACVKGVAIAILPGPKNESCVQISVEVPGKDKVFCSMKSSGVRIRHFLKLLLRLGNAEDIELETEITIINPATNINAMIEEQLPGY